MNAYNAFPLKGLSGDALEDFIAFRGEMQVDWDAKRPEIAACAAPPKATSRSDDLSNPTYCGWDDVAPIPSDDDPSWSVFGVSQTQEEEVKPQIRGGKKLTKEQRQKLKDEEQLREARESIRKRGWSENEVKWRSWLARRGRDVMVNDWNLSQYIDGECIPPSRDPFWLNANEKPLPDYEAGNDVCALGPACASLPPIRVCARMTRGQRVHGQRIHGGDRSHAHQGTSAAILTMLVMMFTVLLQTKLVLLPPCVLSCFLEPCVSPLPLLRWSRPPSPRAQAVCSRCAPVRPFESCLWGEGFMQIAAGPHPEGGRHD
uniref:Uncharacterized protein n=1 Tax=Chrysotila carterae TaxID=13221 RepID=A0A7S4BE22_CHRCT